MGEIIERRCWWIVAAILAIGLALRLAAAQGGLWLDEAWSAVMAHQAGAPISVFLNINHDNNHHLNTLWLLAIGFDAPPLLQRGLSIAAGTTTIVFAALIGARRSRWMAIVAACLFALSPILVTYGSEARGYAPMLLAFLIAAWLIDRWLDRPEMPPPAVPVAIAALLGVLAQLTMVFGLGALGLWSLWSLWSLHRADRLSLWQVARLWGPATMATAVALALIFVPSWQAGGMAFGSAEPLSLASWVKGFWQAIDYGFGEGVAITGVLLVLLLATGTVAGRFASFAIAALLTPPVVVLLAQLPNAGGGRIYLISAVGALLLVAGQIDHARARGQRRLAALALALVMIAMSMISARVVLDRRADPARAVQAIAVLAPAGADAAVERPRSDAILIAAAASARYELQIRQACPAARFLFIERDGDEPFPPAPNHCGAAYREIAGDTVQGLSGTQWKLYERSAR